jgi:uncharacterized protein YwbE/predicted HTH transcriptional regulator
MLDLTRKNNVKEGLHVLVKEFPDQNENEYSEGIITGILPQPDIVSDGIRVTLNTGSIGNVKELVGPENSIELIQKRLKDRENLFVEKKSTFSYDVVLDGRNDYLQTVAAIAVSSFLNTDGGFVYLGVSDDGVPLGLDLDYSLMSSRPNNDGLEDKIRNSFSKILGNNIELQQCLSYNFPIIDNKEICEIHVKPSKKPIFLQAKKCTVIIDDKHKPQRWIDDFYIRRGNSHYLIEKNSELFEYFMNRFHSV